MGLSFPPAHSHISLLQSGSGSPADDGHFTRISIHPPRAGWDIPPTSEGGRIKNFNPPTPCGVGLKSPEKSARASEFQSTHPVRGGTKSGDTCEETYLFQSTHPVRGGTFRDLVTPNDNVFQSTHPVRGGTGCRRRRGGQRRISIHPPRAGWDEMRRLTEQAEDAISIHPPRAGWDLQQRPHHIGVKQFQSTHPVRGGTHHISAIIAKRRISIHPPRAGWDSKSSQKNGENFCKSPQRSARRV